MSHPFELELYKLEAIELDFEQQLTDEEAAKIGGGIKGSQKNKDKEPIFTTLAVGEEGGYVTTQALGEEGGDFCAIELPLA